MKTHLWGRTSAVLWNSGSEHHAHLLLPRSRCISQRQRSRAASGSYTAPGSTTASCLCRQWPLSLPSYERSSLSVQPTGKGTPTGREREASPQQMKDKAGISLDMTMQWPGRKTKMMSRWWPFLTKCASLCLSCGSQSSTIQSELHDLCQLRMN